MCLSSHASARDTEFMGLTVWKTPAAGHDFFGCFEGLGINSDSKAGLLDQQREQNTFPWLFLNVQP